MVVHYARVNSTLTLTQAVIYLFTNPNAIGEDL